MSLILYVAIPSKLFNTNYNTLLHGDWDTFTIGSSSKSAEKQYEEVFNSVYTEDASKKCKAILKVEIIDIDRFLNNAWYAFAYGGNQRLDFNYNVLEIITINEIRETIKL